MWLCQQCGLENIEDRVVCENCDGIRVNDADDSTVSRHLEELFFEGTGI